MSTYIIGELGTNHNGNIYNVFKAADMCKALGVNCLKLQKRNPSVCIPEDQKYVLRDTPWGQMNYIDYKEKMEFDEEDYDIINGYCKNIDLAWTASVWDVDSVEFINQYDVPFIKIPSAKITDMKLLSAVAKTNKDIIMSIGMSTLSEVNNALNYLYDNTIGAISVLQCNSSYPAKDTEANLALLETLKDDIRIANIGYSSHELGNEVCKLAVAAGATIIEKHITTDKDAYGTDQAISLNKLELSNLVDDITYVEEIMGSPVIKVRESELPFRKKLR